MKRKVICIHIGARAHYLIPKALQAKDKLSYLITDTWVSSSPVRSRLAKSDKRIVKSFAGRYSDQIPLKAVRSFSLYFLFLEVYLRFKKLKGWPLIIARNDYFQKAALKIFKQLPAQDAVLGISYTSLELFKVAKQRSQKTILFQIDPGLKEEQMVAAVVAKYGNVYTTSWEPAPPAYWEKWREECRISDVIMANSEWSKSALIEEGINEDKIEVIPLPFQVEQKHLNYTKTYPDQFTQQRPLRCLFLGTLTLRKGIHIVLDVASKLTDQPIEFVLVGENELDTSLLNGANVTYKGVASREATDLHYQSSDIFLFPTISDGFGLTQLEAMAWQLPVVASTNCGKVVQDGYNGISLNKCDADELTHVLLKCINEPNFVKQLSNNCLSTVKEFSLDNFAESISKLANV